MTLSPPVHDFPNPPTLQLVAPEKPFPKVFIALCTRDWLTEAHVSESVREMGNRCKCQIRVAYMMNDGVARSRNNLAAMFLEDKSCTHMLFLDNDIIMETYHLDRLLEADKPIIGGLYPKKQAKLDWVVNYLPESKPDANGRMKVKHLGTGCWLVRRAELEAFIEREAKRNPDFVYRGDPSPDAVRYDLFPMHARAGAYLSEDWYFCERWIADGGEIWADTRITLRHIGKIVYPLQYTLSDDDIVDIIQNRYGIWADIIRSFVASGSKLPGFPGGHRERPFSLWPEPYGLPFNHQGDVLCGCYDVPDLGDMRAKPPTLIDLGADAGAFMRWAFKRFAGATIHSYEPDGAKGALLVQSRDGLTKASGSTALHAYTDPINPEMIATLPKATIIKIDLPGREREIIDALHFSKRLPEFDAVLIKYSSDLQAFFINTIMQQTHFVHCQIRRATDSGVIKYVRNDLHPEQRLLRDSAPAA